MRKEVRYAQHPHAMLNKSQKFPIGRSDITYGLSDVSPIRYNQKGGPLPYYQAADSKIGEFTGEFTMDDLRGTEMLSGLDEPGQYQIDFVNYVNTGIGGDKLGQGLKKAEAMRQHHLKKKIEYHNKRDHGFLEPGWTPPKYQAANTSLPNAGDAPQYLQAGSFDRSSRTFAYQDPQTQPGEDSYGMNPQALDFSNLPIASPTMNNANQNISTAPNMFMGYAQKGGYVNPNASFEAERGEVIEHPPGDPAIALEHGGTVRNSNNYQKLTGNKHSDPEGGPQMTGAEGGFVYSDFLKMPKDLVEQLKYLT